MASLRLVVFGLLLLLSSPVPAQRDAINETYFILTNAYDMAVLNLQGEVQHELNNSNCVQVDFDSTTARIFWPDRSRLTIDRSFLNASQRTVLRQLPSGSNPAGVAVDHLLQLVFYTDLDKHLIGVMDTEGGSHRIVRDQGLTRPLALAVDVIHEFLYYTEGQNPGNIGRMTYFGSNHEILQSGLQVPYGLALDVRGGRMYWSTHSDGKIESARLDGMDRIFVQQVQTYQLGLAFFGGVLYFSFNSARSIFSLTISGTNQKELKMNMPPVYHDVAVYSKLQAITLEEKLAALGPAATQTPASTTNTVSGTHSTEPTVTTATQTPASTTNTVSGTHSTEPTVMTEAQTEKTTLNAVATSGPSLGAMIGGIVGGALGLTLVVVLVIVVWKLRGRREQRKAEDHYSGLHLDTRQAPRDQTMYDQLQGHQNPAGPHPDQANPYYSELGPPTPDQANPYYSGLDPGTKVKPEPAPYEKLGKLQNMTNAQPPSGAGTEKSYENAAHPDAAKRPGPHSYYYNLASRQGELR